MKLIFGVIFTFVAVLFVVEIVNSVSYYSKDDYIVIKVEDKDRSTSEDGSVYRVYTEHETFEIADSLFPPVFNSADRYRKLKRNQFYRCRAIGFRSDVLSRFRNLVDCRKYYFLVPKKTKKCLSNFNCKKQ